MGYFRSPDVQLFSNASSGCTDTAGFDLGKQNPFPIPSDNYPENETTANAAYLLQQARIDAVANQAGEVKSLAAGAGHTETRTPVLVAVGDNFAPYVLSRRMFNDVTGAGYVDKGEYEYNPSPNQSPKGWAKNLSPAALEAYLNGNGKLLNDNVGCFFRQMGFDALVPGRHDFYFGPERLRELAKFLREGKAETRMLGANLYFAPRYIDFANDPSPSVEAQVGVTAAGADKSKSDSGGLTMPKTALPWMRSVVVKGTKAKAAVVEVCLFPLPKQLNNGTARSYHFDAKTCSTQPGAVPLKIKSAEDEQSAEFRMDRAAKPLDPGLYAATALNADGSPVGQPKYFAVAFPFFEYPASNRSAGGQTLSDLKPWRLVKNADGQDVAVFGVVGSDLLDGVGALNSMWLFNRGNGKNLKGSTDNDREIDVQIADAADSLKQVFQYCEADTECKAARKILLAQMSQSDAYDLGAHLVLDKTANPVDLVVAEADAERASQDRELARTLPPTVVSPEKKYGNRLAPLVVVPGLQYTQESPYKLSVSIQAATVVPEFYVGSEKRQMLVNRVYPRPDDRKPLVLDPVPPARDKTSSEAPKSRGGWAGTPPSAGTYFDSAPPYKAPSTQFVGKFLPMVQQQYAVDKELWSGWEQVVLFAMREACPGAKIAIMQHRDLFRGPELLKPPLSKDVLAAILWKGDFVVCKQLTGAAINSLLKQSKQFDDDQANGLLTPDKLDYGLATLGADVTQTDDSKRQINGQLLDPAQLYGVAMTDFLAGGSTGYTALQGSDQPPVDKWSTLLTRDLLNAVSSLVLPWTSTESPWQKAPDVLDSAHLDPNLWPGGRAFVHPVEQKPKGFVDWAKALAANLIPASRKLDKSDKPDNPDKPDKPEDWAQQQPAWSINLYKADFNYSLFLHRDSETAMSTNFPGVTAVNVSQTENNTKAADYVARIEHNSLNFVEYFQSSLNYGYRLQRTISPSSTPNTSDSSTSPPPSAANPQEPYTPSQTADYWYSELGLGYRLAPRFQSPSGWKAVVASGFETQPAHPFTQFSASAFVPPGYHGGITQPPPMPNAPTAPLAVKARRTLFPSGRAGLRYDFNFPKPQSNAQASGAAASGGSSGSMAGASGGGRKKKGGGQSGTSQSASGQGGGGQGGGQSQTQTLSSYLEFGFEKGAVYHGVSQYNFAKVTIGDGTTKDSCPVADLTCLAAVGEALSGTKGGGASTNTSPGTLISVNSGRTHQQRGFYFNLRLDAPIPTFASQTFFAGSEMVLENRGEWFLPHEDLYLDTRLNDDLKLSLTVPIWKKISFSPSVEMLFFKNQVFRNFYYSYSTSVSLNYSFEWHPGLGWRRALMYSNPVPALPTLPSR